MSFLAWNCRGIGQPSAVRSLGSLVRATRPCIVFLSETKNKKNYLNSVRSRLGFTSGFLLLMPLVSVGVLHFFGMKMLMLLYLAILKVTLMFM